VEPALVVIGVSFRSAPVELREKFWINESGYAEVLAGLLRCEAVDEVAVLSTCNRTEFVVWTPDASQAANSVLRYLTREHNLRLAEWSKFHRHVDDAAVTHLCRLASGLDSLVFGEAEITANIEFAYRAGVQAQSVGRCLEAILLKALAIARRVRTETEIVSNLSQSSLTPVELARQLYDDLERRALVIFGSGKKSQRIAELFRNAGMTRVEVVPPNRGYGTLKAAVASADLLLTCVPDAAFALQRSHVAEFIRERDRQLVIIDTAMPRNVDPAVCELPKVTLQNIDQLNEFVLRNAKQQHNVVVQAEKILRCEAAGFLKQVTSEQVNPVVAKFRAQLGRICSEELERLNEEYGPFTQEQYEVLNALGEHVMQRIAGSLSRILADQPSALEQETLLNLLHGMFHVEAVLSASAAAGGQDAAQREQTAPCAASGEHE
jgi:glutamyl-tRNA reductase